MGDVYFGKKNTRYETKEQLGNDGATAQVFSLTSADQADFVVKIYKEATLKDHGADYIERKLQKIQDRVKDRVVKDRIGNFVFAWPTDLVYDQEGNFKGFIMPKIDSCVTLEDRIDKAYFLWKKQSVEDDQWAWSFQMNIAYAIATLVCYLHDSGFAICDFNPRNFLFTEDENGELIFNFIDCDSYGLFDTNTHEVLYKPFAFGGTRTEELVEDFEPDSCSVEDMLAADYYSVAFWAFRLLTYSQLYYSYEARSASADDMNIERAKLEGIFPFGKKSENFSLFREDEMRPGVLPIDVLSLFYKTFNYSFVTIDTQKYERATAKEWHDTLFQYVSLSNNPASRIKRCTRNIMHFYSDHLSFCPWCNMDKVSKLPYEERVKINPYNECLPGESVIPDGTMSAPSPKPLPTVPVDQTKPVQKPEPKSNILSTEKKYVTIEDMDSSRSNPKPNSKAINVNKRYKVSAFNVCPKDTNGKCYVKFTFPSTLDTNRAGTLKTIITTLDGKEYQLNEIELKNRAGRPVWLIPKITQTRFLDSYGTKIDKTGNQVVDVSIRDRDSVWYLIEAKTKFGMYLSKIRDYLRRNWSLFAIVFGVILVFLISYFVGWYFTDVGEYAQNTTIASENMTDAAYKAFYQESLKAFQTGLKKGDYSSVLCTAKQVDCLCKNGTVKVFGDYENAYNDYSGKYSDWKKIKSIVALDDGNLAGLKEDGTVIAEGKTSIGTVDTSAWSDIVQIGSSGSKRLLYGMKSDGSVVYTPSKDNVKSESKDFQWDGIDNLSGCEKIIPASVFNYKDKSYEAILGLMPNGTIALNYSWITWYNYGDDNSRKVSSLRNIKDVLCVNGGMICLTNNGTVLYDASDFLSDEMDSNVLDKLTDITGIAAGYKHFVALKADGTVVATGKNDFGQCDVNEWTKIVKIEAYGDTTIGYRKNGSIVIAGYNPLEEKIGSYN